MQLHVCTVYIIGKKVLFLVKQNCILHAVEGINLLSRFDLSLPFFLSNSMYLDRNVLDNF